MGFLIIEKKIEGLYEILSLNKQFKCVKYATLYAEQELKMAFCYIKSTLQDKARTGLRSEARFL